MIKEKIDCFWYIISNLNMIHLQNNKNEILLSIKRQRERDTIFL